jgi:hypothetical protein
MNLQEKIEKDLIRYFSNYADVIIQKVNLLADAFEFLMGFRLGKKFRQICNDIGVDPRFRAMNSFKNTVRKLDREVEDLMGKIKQRAQLYPDKRADADTPVEKFEPLYMRFYREIDPLIKELYTPSEIPKEPIVAPLIDTFAKAKEWVKAKLMPEFTAQDLEDAERFRFRTSEDELLGLIKPLSNKTEIEIFQNYAKAVQGELEQFEERGWFNSVKHYAKAYLGYLEKIAEFHDRPDRYEVQDVIRIEFNRLKDWLGRVGRKYADAPQLNLDRESLFNEEMKGHILQYKIDRKAIRLYDETRQILKLIKK